MSKKIDVSKKILGENEQSAYRNSHFFAKNKNFCIKQKLLIFSYSLFMILYVMERQ